MHVCHSIEQVHFMSCQTIKKHYTVHLKQTSTKQVLIKYIIIVVQLLSEEFLELLFRLSSKMTSIYDCQVLPGMNV
jgi:hypothetical protein